MRTKFQSCTLQASAGAVLLFAAALAASPVHADFYKCVSADGSTTYNDAPCAPHENTFLLSKKARAIDGLDCRIARNFAFDAVARMRQKDTAVDVFEAYGGAEALTPAARALINHVYSYQADSFISAQKIVELTMDRCHSGLLGESLTQCEAYPQDFIKRFGSCIDARQNEQRGQVMPTGASATSQAKNGASSGGRVDTPTLKAAKPAFRFGEKDPKAGRRLDHVTKDVSPND